MTDPADAPTTPTVPIALLKHDLPDGTWHLDLLIGVDASGTLPLRSIRTVKHPGGLELGDATPCQVAEDHDPKWIRHQGTVSNNRGETTRIDGGEACWIRHGDESFEVAIQFGQEGPWQHFSIDGASEVMTCLGILESPPPAIDSRRGMDERTTVMTDPSTEDPASESPEEKHASTPAIEQPVPIAQDDRVIKLPKKIKAFEKERHHEDGWIRTPNTTGSGAIHVRTFHAKLTGDALRYMDQMVNEWLDAHPQYEVKFVNSTVGTLSGKLKEPNLICQVWV